MPNTYSQIYLHFVFAVSGRRSLIPPQHKIEIHKYITGIIQRRKAKLLAIHCMTDHIHIFSSLLPTIYTPDFVKEIKVQSHDFIQSKISSRFNCQEGYGVFSYGQSQINGVCDYIMNQENHHKKRTFQEEYKGLLTKFNVPFEDKYLFKWIE
jgi:putative transposase